MQLTFVFAIRKKACSALSVTIVQVLSDDIAMISLSGRHMEVQERECDTARTIGDDDLRHRWNRRTTICRLAVIEELDQDL